MKKLLLINRILLIFSFLLPFLFFERCGPSIKEKEAAIEKAKQDSINAAVEAQRQTDSVSRLNSQISYQDSLNSSKNAKQDSLETSELTNNNKKDNLSFAIGKKEDKFLYKIWEHMLFPTDSSISALGVSILTIEIEIKYFDYKKFKIRDLQAFLIPLNLLFAIILLLLVIFKKIKLSRIFSIISLLFFIVAVFLYQNQGILWGFWVAFILNMIDLILVNLILYKPKQE
jgi:hypothetical protein